jgi:predicted nuclease of predicted toxin-antitoxin system
MALGLLLDQNLPFGAVKVFKELGISATHVSSVGLAGRTDREIWRYAAARDLVVVTKDQDFMLINDLGLSTPVRVVLLAIGNTTNRHLFPRLQVNWKRAQALLDAGNVLIVLQ